ncbi:DUF309 domain-containing protein [Sulfurimonas sp.]|uniref:DUF309 domain-containing protein n=1 Tax=Sulfurimonas sp. TaxID=2022749 RepID=UPI0025EB3FDD|nr:DUF309 domain-containing protein [Sulfurimonas sp.]
MPIKHLNEFVKCLDEQRYFDAHEALEEIWFPRRFEDDEMKLLKGFINAAVSFELQKRSRADASDRVWKNYLKYRPLLDKIDSPYLDRYHFIAKHLKSIKTLSHQ